MSLILRVAVPTPLAQLFDYLPPQDTDRPCVGARVLVPYGNQTLVGVVVEHAEQSSVPADKLRCALQVLDRSPLFDGASLALCRWAADYYHHPIGETLHAALPVALRKATAAALPQEAQWHHSTHGKGLPATALKRGSKQQRLHQLLLEHGALTARDLAAHGITTQTAKALVDKGLVEHTKRPLQRAAAAQLLSEPHLPPTDEQRAVLDQLRYHHYGAYLLEGNTGSGKTEVYLQAITRVLNQGKQALVLVPEIGLTPLLLARFQQRFQVPIVELHSNVAAGRRTENWLRAAAGEARIVIGTRLAVFTPMPELGMIVIDEEHDASFKQQDGLRYSARDVAVMRAHRAGIPLLLGSATPALETLHNALQGRYEHLRLTRRAGAAKPPELHCFDMRREAKVGPFAQRALAAIAATLTRGEQVLVFINRRGFAPALLCEQCGHTASCRACSAKLTLHQTPAQLRCHHCDASLPVPKRCPACGHAPLQPVGQGTERLEAWLEQRFAGVSIRRVDQDSMQRKGAMQQLMTELAAGEPCILVGTQMLAKGHHFPKVTLVVLLDVDQALFSGDFRALERLGQQVVQVAGRAGRESLPGQVILQSYQADHPLLTLLLAEGYQRYARALLRERQVAQLPPYWAMALLRAESKRAANAEAFLQLAAAQLRILQPPSPAWAILGPLPALLEKRQDRYRYLLQVTAASRAQLQLLLGELRPRLASHALARRVRWSIDVDPADSA